MRFARSPRAARETKCRSVRVARIAVTTPAGRPVQWRRAPEEPWCTRCRPNTRTCERAGKTKKGLSLTAVLIELGGGRQQLPVLRHNHGVDDVDDAIRCSDVPPADMRSIDLQVPIHHCRKRTTLNSHHLA